MRLINVKRMCPYCMEEHEVRRVEFKKLSLFKKRVVEYDADYMYCSVAGDIFMDEQQTQNNDRREKDAYRIAEGLLTSYDIIAIRAKYDITQSDLCVLLGWGGKTIARYESHQVQDRAHDAILKKIDRDPEWFLSLLVDARYKLSREVYRKYREASTALYEAEQDQYLRKAIQASYAKYYGRGLFSGNVELSLDKVVDVIRYFAASKEIEGLYKGKLMKLMWYADALSYKITKFAITGLVYFASRMGAVPIGHNLIIHLKGVPCEEMDMGVTNTYRFFQKDETRFPSLLEVDKIILDAVIKKLGKMSKDEIIPFIYKEQAFKEALPKDVIKFQNMDSLQI